MNITTQEDGTVLALIDTTEPHDGRRGTSEYVIASPTAIAVRMELLGYDTIPDTIQAIHDMRDPSATDPTNNVWSPLYKALQTSLTQTRTLATDTDNTEDPLTTARNTARKALGLPEITDAKIMTAAALADGPTLPDGLADQVAAARTRFLESLTTKE